MMEIKAWAANRIQGKLKKVILKGLRCLPDLSLIDDEVYQAMEALVLRCLPDLSLIQLREELTLIGKMDYPRHEIRLRVTSPVEYKMRLRSCQKEPWTVEWIETNVKPGDVFYDIGANVGAYSLIAAKTTGGKARILAFEPGFSTFPELCYNIIINQCQESVLPLPIALSAKTGVMQFNYRDLTPGRALHALKEIDNSQNSEANPFQPVYQQLMLSYALDDLIRQFDLPPPNHIKIDVDGTELAVLRGAAETLSSADLKTLMVEVNENEQGWDRELIQYIESKNFQLQTQNKPYSKQGLPKPLSYCMFVKKALV